MHYEYTSLRYIYYLYIIIYNIYIPEFSVLFFSAKFGKFQTTIEEEENNLSPPALYVYY